MIGLADRGVAVGHTGTGKSEAMLYLWAESRRQRLLVDVQDHYRLGPAALAEGGLEIDSLAELDWRVRTIRFVPRSWRVYDDLYAAVYHRGDLDVLLDEAYGPTRPGLAPAFLVRAVTQGRKRRIRHLTTTQRPAKVLPELIDQAEHAYIFPLTLEQDLRAVALRTGLEPRELAGALHTLERLPRISDTAEPTGYLYHRLGRPELMRMPPLPAERIAVTRRHVLNPS